MLFGKRLPMEYQTENSECGLACLVMIASYYGYKTDLARLRSKYKISLRGVTAEYLIQVATRINLQCEAHRVEMYSLDSVQTPAILHWDQQHFVVLKKVHRKGITIHDPKMGVVDVSPEDISKHFTGVVLEITPNLQFHVNDDRQVLNIRRIMGKVTGLKRSLVQTLMLAAALEIFQLVQPMLMQLVIDDALVTNDKDLLWLIMSAIIFIGLMRSACGLVRNWVLLHLSVSMNLQWVGNVIQHLLKLPTGYFEKRTLGDIMSRFSAVVSIQQTLTTSFLSAILDGVMSVATLVMMYVYSPKLATIALLAVCLYASLRLLRYDALRTASEGQVQRQARQQTKFMEMVRGIKTVKLFNSQTDYKARYMKLAIDSANSGILVQRLNINFQTLNAFIVVVEGVLILGIGCFAVLDPTAGFSIGMLMAILSYKDQFTTRVTSLVDKGIEFKMLRIPVNRLADIVLTPPEQDLIVTGIETEIEPTIELIDVGFRYSEGEDWVVRHVNMKINTGESVVLIGPSGCGKTTLMNIMLAELQPTEGKILFGGKPMSQIGLSHYRGTLSVVMQDDRLFSGSLADNIGFGSMSVNMEQVEDAAKRAEIYDDISKMPMGFETLVGDLASAMSGGQKQRMFLARALYKNPRILFLDEATSHLDVALDLKLSAKIAGMKMTRVVIAHRPETIANSGRVIPVNPDQWLPKGITLKDVNKVQAQHE